MQLLLSDISLKGNFVKALELSERSLELTEQELGSNHVLTAECNLFDTDIFWQYEGMNIMADICYRYWNSIIPLSYHKSDKGN